MKIFDFLQVSSVLSSIILLSSCADFIDDSESPISDIPSSKLPNYRVGDFFLFDNGPDYRVSEITGNEITWKLGKTFTFKTSPNFIFPWTSWESKESSSESESDSDPNSLWPLKLGNKARIKRDISYIKNNSLKEKGGPRAEYSEDRDCSVVATVNVEVPAGTFETYKIKCNRYINSSSYVGTRYYYYSPVVGHFVKQVDVTGLNVTSNIQLVSYGISLEVLEDQSLQGLNQHFQYSLDTVPTGRVSEWTSRDDRQKSSITPTRTYVVEGKTFCRDYIQKININGRERSITGRACRDKIGVWVAPK